MSSAGWRGSGSFSFRRIDAQQALSGHRSPSRRSDFSRDPCRLSRLKPLLHRRQTEN